MLHVCLKAFFRAFSIVFLFFEAVNCGYKYDYSLETADGAASYVPLLVGFFDVA
jgi:hypothetical protein